MKSLLLSMLLVFSFLLNAQQNFFTASYGLNIADEDRIRERGHYIGTNNLVLKASYAKEITEFIRGKVDIAYAD